jgi:FkbM family methyltransferase
MRRILKAIARDMRDVISIGPAFPLRRHISELFLGTPLYTTKIAGVKVHLRSRSSDVEVFRQVFSCGEYDFSGTAQFRRLEVSYNSLLSSDTVPVIIDAGANVGAATIWFAQLFPRACIIAVEPDPQNARLCKLNTRGLANVQVLEAAFGCSAGSVNLIDADKAAWAVQTVRSEATGPVPILTVSDILRHAGEKVNLFLVKIDIEGFEEDVFSKSTEWLADTKALIIEPHDWLFPGRYSSRPFQTAIAGERFELLIRGENLIYIR